MQTHTNNPDVLAAYPHVVFHEGGVRDVYLAVRNAIHCGAKLVTHPQSGNLAPNESPYKTVVVTAGTGGLDFNSLQLMEAAITFCDRLPPAPANLPAQVLADFRMIDFALIKDTLDNAL